VGEIVIFTTGGTIASRHDETAGGLVSKPVAIEGWVQQQGGTRVVELAARSSTSITPTMLTAWAEQIQAELDKSEVTGAVVATGTNTMVEVAFFLELVVRTTKNLVITGAMNAPENRSFDGDQNLERSISLARTTEIVGAGTLVLMNDQVHAAQFVEKTDANGIHAFESPQAGPLARFIPDAGGGHFRFFSTPNRWDLGLSDDWMDSRPATGIHDPKIWVLKAYLGADSSPILSALDNGVDGLIIEGFPSGELPPDMALGIRRAVDLGIPVAVTCDAQRGEPTDIYAGLGEGAWLSGNKVIFAAGIPAGKAHMCMYVALQRGYGVRQALTQM
jgi:L-asparaginase